MTTAIHKIQWAAAAQAIQAAQSVLVIAHISPDGDAIGSMLGVTNALRAMGKTVIAAVDEGVPDFLQFLPGADSIQASLDSGEWDLMIATDCGDLSRTGKVGQYGVAHSQTVINLDHHPTNTYFGDISLVVDTAVSAAEIVFDLWQYLSFPINADVAIPLLTGLVTDTLGFRTSNVVPRTLEIAQDLIRAGAQLNDITARTLDSRSYLVVKLWKEVLPSVSLKQSVASAVVRLVDAERAGLTETVDGGLVSFLVKIDEATIAVVFREKSENKVEISLRSKPSYDVSQVAFQLGGGGHKQASGATIDGTVEEVQAKVMPLLYQVVRNGKRQID